MSGARAADGALAATAVVLEQLFQLVRRVALHGEGHDEVAAAADALREALRRAAPPFTLQLLPEAVLRDGRPIPLDLEVHRRSQQLVGAFARWNLTELAVEALPEPDTLVAFAQAVLDATHSNRPARVPRLPGLGLRALCRAGPRHRGGDAADERFVLGQIERALAELERVLARLEQPWPWSEGRAVVWRVERCLLSSPAATLRALELLTPPITHARRALLAACHVQAVLFKLHAGLLIQRAAAQALLVLGAHGLGERPGASLGEAARRAWPHLAPLGVEAQAIDPQRLRATALIAAALDAERVPPALPVLGLVSAAYELERQRCAHGPDLQLSRVDLQAWLAGALGREVHAGFGRALLEVAGAIPAGSHVLADGRLGVVLGPGQKGDALRPRVLVGGEIGVPAQPVTPYSPLGMTPWAK